ncbi:Pecanex-like protein 1 [Actinoplanes sp. ATCC 53533]|uniref:Pecanex-like protein 1 n=1 Tax=Actinoplanes sp. ATCC 53533 TaxID=1288362 RepID=UPI001F231F3A|nr:Pecanex-like protein 1 [Actinoplanes sp. ATCC 53533]
MRRSQYRRESSKSKWFTGRRRIIAAVATLVAFGGIVTVTQVSDASTKKSTQRALAACNNLQAPKSTKLSSKTRKGTYTTNGGKVTQHADDGAGSVPTAAEMRNRCRQWVMQNAGNNTGGNNNGGAASPAPAVSGNTNAGEANGGNNNGGNNNAGNNNGGNNAGNNGGNNAGGGNAGGNAGNNGGNNGGAVTPPPGAGLGVLANSCEGSQLEPHDGFQKGNRCVSTEFGEVGAAANNASLLITEAPEQVGVNQAFTLKVSTRNLIRDRFLAAGQGGYYVESSILQGGIVRGHFHTACRMLANTDEAPDPAPAPAFFVATEDQRGGAAPDVVTIQVAGLPQNGTAQCASWAGDGSHRIPMMERANQTPAFDAVRIEVGGGGGNQGNQGNQQQNQNQQNQNQQQNQGGNNNGQNNN